MIYDYEYFKKEIYSLTTIDLNAYKEKQMKRRIDTLIAKHKIVGYDKYVQALKTDKVLFEEFVGYITINVSEFYRNPEQWKYLEETVIPELIQRFGKNLKVWSAACSTGDEPYSLVMALSRHIPLQQIRIYATDLDKQVIAKAKTGLYGEKSIEGVNNIFLILFSSDYLASTGASVALAGVERISTQIAQIAFSFIVFYAFHKKKYRYLMLAIVLHTVYDFSVILLNYGLSPSVLEMLLFVASIVLLLFTMKYKKGVFQNEENC